MAIIAKLDTCGWLFGQHEALQNLYMLFESCLQGDYKKQDYQKGKRVDLDCGIFAMLQTYKLKPYKKAFFETHKQYVDLQLTISGNECFMIGDSRDFIVTNPYNAEKDLVIYQTQKFAHRIITNSAYLCVFFPNDVHAGGLQHKSIVVNRVYKVVAKVPRTLLNIS